MSIERFFDDAYRTARGNDSGWTQASSGLFLPPKPRRYDRPIALDLFSGCGGFSLGVELAGFQVVGAVEWWPAAAQAYLLNLGAPDTRLHLGSRPFCGDISKAEERKWLELAGQTVPAKQFFPSAGTNPQSEVEAPVQHFWLADVSELTGAEILAALNLEPGDLDLVVGGPPCQGFSVAGRRQVTDPRNSGVFEFARLVCELMPKAFAMENVPGMLSMTTTEGIPVVDALCHIFQEGGMGSYESLRKMLLSTAGTGAALRTGPDKKPPETVKTQSQELEGQMDLFEMEGAC